MARVIAATSVWAEIAGEYNLDAVDAVLAGGKLVFAFGGVAANMDAQLRYAAFDPQAGALEPLVQLTFPQYFGGSPFARVSAIDLGPDGTGGVRALIHLTEQASDSNGGLRLLTLPATGAGSVVEAATSPDVSPDAALIQRADGSAQVFYTEKIAGFGESNGILMRNFDAAGQAVGDPVVVVPEHLVGGPFRADANPVIADATLMADGRIGLTWTESSPLQAPGFGQPRVMFQVLDAAGTAQGPMVEIDGTSALSSQILTLASGKMVVAWSDHNPGDRGLWKAQMLDAGGAKLGGVFEISSGLSTQESELDLVSLAGGGFAASWRNLDNQVFYGRVFNDQGAAKGADFQLVEAGGMALAEAGIVAKGKALYGFAHGIPDGTGFRLIGAIHDTAASWGLRSTGGPGAETVAGTALDDVISGQGGADRLTGAEGSDRIDGGSGRDTIAGGAGADLIWGGKGPDRISGGSGADAFVFRDASEGGDLVSDYDRVEGDIFYLSTAGFGGVTRVGLAAPTVAGPALWWDQAAKTLHYDADGAGAGAAVDVFQLTSTGFTITPAFAFLA